MFLFKLNLWLSCLNRGLGVVIKCVNHKFNQIQQKEISSNLGHDMKCNINRFGNDHYSSVVITMTEVVEK